MISANPSEIMITITPIIGIVLSLFFLSKKMSVLKKVAFFGLLLSFITILMGYFKLSTYAYMGYGIMLLIAIMGILIIEVRGKVKENIIPLVILLIWLLSVLTALLNIRYHFEVLFGKILITVPLSVIIFVRNKNYNQFTLFWVILYLMYLMIDVYNSYM